MRLFENYWSPGASKCLPPPGGVAACGDRPATQFVDHRNLIMTGSNVYQTVISLQLAFCLLNLFLTESYRMSVTFDDQVCLMLLPQIYAIMVAIFGLYEVNSVDAKDVRVQDVVCARYLALICSNLCYILSELGYLLRDFWWGEMVWFAACIALHRCYECRPFPVLESIRAVKIKFFHREKNNFTCFLSKKIGFLYFVFYFLFILHVETPFIIKIFLPE